MKSTTIQILKCQSGLIHDLFQIYPIQVGLSKTDIWQNDTIRQLKVPSNSVFAKLDKEVISTALGFVSHLVAVIAHYLFIPLRYPIYPKSSRSYITDPVSQSIEGFPLHAKSGDRMRFEYGVFLLNKDVEQIMHSVGLPARNLRCTLANILSICHHLIHYCQTAALDGSASTPVVNWTLLNLPLPMKSGASHGVSVSVNDT
ncbi:hypothetical protein HDV03_002382 [Kappamyces sp. JEL0829]|nr:hypothetical protein HDV03_002382 [Kappamyces sp. JEL0829]